MSFTARTESNASYNHVLESFSSKDKVKVALTGGIAFSHVGKLSAVMQCDFFSHKLRKNLPWEESE
jgi:hypothetical protein